MVHSAARWKAVVITGLPSAESTGVKPRRPLGSFRIDGADCARTESPRWGPRVRQWAADVLRHKSAYGLDYLGGQAPSPSVEVPSRSYRTPGPGSTGPARRCEPVPRGLAGLDRPRRHAIASHINGQSTRASSAGRTRCSRLR